MGPSAGAANFCQRFNKCLCHPLATGSGPHEKIIQSAAAPGEDDFRQVKKQREAQRLIGAEGRQDFSARIIGDQLQHLGRLGRRGAGQMRRHFRAIGGK